MDEDFREVRCRCCQRVFYLCRRHDRGQGYCGDECRATVRAAQKRAARATHQASVMGQEDHRDRMRDHRERRVMDQGSQKVDLSTTVLSDAGPALTIGADETRAEGNSDARATELIRGLRPNTGRIRCAVCGDTGRFIRSHHLAWSRRRRPTIHPGTGPP